jgi:hypothetical protein
MAVLTAFAVPCMTERYYSAVFRLLLGCDAALEMFTMNTPWEFVSISRGLPTRCLSEYMGQTSCGDWNVSIPPGAFR